MENAPTDFDGQARKQQTTFRRSVEVGIEIAAPAAQVWSLLTDAEAFPEWNSTVTSVDGSIAQGQTIRLKATVAPDRTFKLKVSDVVANKGMVWADGMRPMFRGVRTYTLSKAQDGQGTRFHMVEVFTGLMLPMIGGQLPDFAPSFEAFAADLKTAAEQAE